MKNIDRKANRSPNLFKACQIHSQALYDRLAKQLHSDPKTRGLTLPTAFEIVPTAAGPLSIQIGSLEQIENSQTITNAWYVNHPEIVPEAELHDVVELAHLAIRRGVQEDVIIFPPPSWAVLIHPVALALILGHKPDRTRYPLSLRVGKSAGPDNWEVDISDGYPMQKHDGFTSVADCWLREDNLLQFKRLSVIAPRTMSALTFTSSVGREPATLSVPGQFPDVIKTSMIGRALGEVFELPASGSPDIDAAAAHCKIISYAEIANGVTLGFEKTDHIPYGEAPTDDHARAMRLAPRHM